MRRSECASWRALRLAVLLLVVISPLRAAEYVHLGQEAPDFALRAMAGSNVRLSEYRGQVVVLSFWSSRCNPCRAQLDDLNTVYATYRPVGLQVLGIAVDDDTKASTEFAERAGVQFPMLADPAKVVARDYEIDALPMVVVIDRGGNVRYVHREPRSRGEPVYVRELRALLDE